MTQRTLFPELERKPDTRDLVGLRVVQVNASLQDTIHKIELLDDKQEIHELDFVPRDETTISVQLDGDEVANIRMEVGVGKNKTHAGSPGTEAVV